MSERSYKYAFVIAVMLCLALAGALGCVLQGHNGSPAEETTASCRSQRAGCPRAALASYGPCDEFLCDAAYAGATVAAASPGDRCNHGDRRNAARSATSCRRPAMSDVNERRLAYVQTRFPGWIQKVLVNASYQYVQRGQPMFTIYSPDSSQYRAGVHSRQTKPANLRKGYARSQREGK